MSSGNPGGASRASSPTPPERGSFPSDHDGECAEYMQKYSQCMRLAANENAHNCRSSAKDYLKCRMDHQLMDKDEWKNLGSPPDDKQ